MKTALTLVVFSMLLLQVNAQEKRTDRDFDELNGPVRLVRTDRQYLPDKNGQPKDNARHLDHIALYDRDGRLTEELDINDWSGDCTRSRRFFTYDTQGSRTEAVYWGAGVVAANRAGATPLFFKQSFKYDRSGRRTEVDEFDTNGKLQSKLVYTYDDKGRVKETAHVYEGKDESGCSYKYNDHGLPSEASCSTSGGFSTKDKTTYAYDYDARGNWVKKTASTLAELPMGKTNESQQIIYRQIEYYADAGGAEAAPQQKTAEVFAGYTPVSCTRPMVIRKSGGAFQQAAIRRALPTYPPAAAAAGLSGTVVVEVTTDEMGKVIAVRSLSGPAELRAAAEEAARGWEFKPTSLSKVPVKVIGTITFNFNR